MINSFNDKPCNGNMVEAVLGVADGTITDIKIKETVLQHITECRTCRELFLDIDVFAEAEQEAEKESSHLYPFIAEIAVKTDGSILTPVGGNFIYSTDTVPVLSVTSQELLVYRIPSSETNIPITLIPETGGILIEIHEDDSETVFYLFGSGYHNISHIYDGIASFHKIQPGHYILSRGMKDFIRIYINAS